MIISGITMLVGLSFPMSFVIKGILAILMIGVLEQCLVKPRKEIVPNYLFCWNCIFIINNRLGIYTLKQFFLDIS